ncbi:acyl-CoA dehydrogenase family protein [Aeromicrobium endophyticum]|uniref:Acyl-CoA dehydrogenase n=1 Tax=Aeromicrobium endophyticum TaxID=2292704 RepID=A0A371PC66_9ACTN|nr:acyl-CoA dehydrogenase family protein [Aeromicrobium endophyticum]REK73513.1 acyl-CoA dehydrogenase [Aeromicrobium endophyticum]
MSAADLEHLAARLLAAHPPASTDRLDFLRAQYDAGLAWVGKPVGRGGLGLTVSDQVVVDAALRAAGAPDNDPAANSIGLGMAAPTLLRYGTPDQVDRFLPPLWTGEEIWCQLFSEPGAGSDLANVSTSATLDGDTWVVNGQKVWTSGAQNARFAILVARTDPSAFKHAGLTYFVCPMDDPGVDVRPLRQITGEAEFNEVFLTDVRIPDSLRIGAVGQGWEVATATLNNERVAIGGGGAPRESGMIGVVAQAWRSHPERRRPVLHDRLMRLWIDAEVARLAAERVRRRPAHVTPGPGDSAAKVTFARIAQQLTALEVELLGDDGMRYDDWTMRRPERVSFTGRGPGYRYLRAKGNSIEGGTSEVLLNLIAERVLGLPAEHRPDKGIPWNESAR